MADGTLPAAQAIAAVLARRAKADNTRRAYRAGVRDWCNWCGSHGLHAPPPRGHRGCTTSPVSPHPHYHCRVETDAAPCCTRSLRATVRGSFLPTKPASTGHRNPPVHQELKPALQPCNQNRGRRITDDDGTSRGMPMPRVRRTSDTGTGSPSRIDAAGTRRLFMTDEKRTHT
jgi:hypothetical protein